MTLDRETVIRLAMEAGTSNAGLNIQSKSVFGLFGRFAALVLEHGRKPLTDRSLHIIWTTKAGANVSWKDFCEIARTVEAAHGITNKESSDADKRKNP